MVQWESIKKDLQKGWKEGVIAVKEGVVVVKKKAGQMTDEGKRQYEVLTLKTKIQKAIHDLGKRVYVLMSSPQTAKSATSDDKVKSIVVQIRKFERQIADREKRPQPKAKAATKKAAAGKKR